MLLFNARLIGLSITGLAVSGLALAQDGKSVTTGAESAKLGGEFRSELTYSDNGFQKQKGVTPDATTRIGLTNVNFKMDGKVNSKTEYQMRFNLLNPQAPNGPVDIAYGKHWFSNTIGFSIGRQKVIQGGFDNIEGGFRSHAVGVYASNMPFYEFEDMLGIHLKLAGDLTVQILNDRSVGGYERFGTAAWNEGSHQTYALGWTGAFGPVSPMLNIGSYDNNKSRWMDIGVKTSMNGLNASLDIYQNTFTKKVMDAAGTKAEGKADVATAITLNLGYTIPKTATPFLYFSTYDNVQEGTDAKVNSATPATATAPASMNWDDNGVVWAVGADLHMMGNGWSPFVAIVNQSGKWADADGKEETKSQMTVKIGAHAEI